MTQAVEARAFAALDRRLETRSDAPLAVAVSGGGDSIALLLLADAWARRVGRDLRVLTVDHGLHPESGRWSGFVAATAGRVGRACDVLAWTGDKPATGLPAAAREARHALLAEAARAARARVILTGHTADDVREGEAMRAEGSTLGRLREWTPSPAWPDGRGVFLLRPLLDLGRGELRAWLRSRGEEWIEDPANEDPRFARSRARAEMAGRPLAPGTAQSDRIGGTISGREESWGGLVLSRTTSTDELGAALLCASGRTRPPRGDRLAALLERLRSGTAVTATLAGARLSADGEDVLVGREPGRAGLPSAALKPGGGPVWDGRFEIAAQEAGVVRALGGSASRLAESERNALKAVPAPFRPTLPVVETASGAVFCPLFTMPVQARSLVGERWLAACGAFTREQDIPRHDGEWRGPCRRPISRP